MEFRLLAGAGLVAMAATGMAQAQNGASEAERNWTAITECASISDAGRRHSCMDDVLMRAGALNPERVAQAAREDFGRDQRAEAPRPAPVRERSAAPPAPAAPAELSEVSTTVQSVRTVGYRRLSITTADGSIWEQTQSEEFTTQPRAGDAFSIERTQLGGYRCRFARSSRYYCRRAD